MDHPFLIMVLFVPLVALLENQIVLFAIAAVSLAVAGVAIYLVARDCFGDARLALLAAVVLWTMPELCVFALSRSWPETLAMPWLALMFWFYLRRRARPFAICAVLVMACMEHFLVFVALFAVVEVMMRRQAKWVALPVGLAVGWIAVIQLISVGLASGRFEAHPLRWSVERLLAYLGSVFLASDRSPLAFLMLLSPQVLLFALPSSSVMAVWGMVVDLAPRGEGSVRYASYLILPMAVGGLLGLQRAAAAAHKRRGLQARTVIGVGLLVTLALHLATPCRMAPAWRRRIVASPAAEAV